jgi:hypothetical protein
MSLGATDLERNMRRVESEQQKKKI